MALPDREGRFKASIIESTVSETGKNNLLTFTARYALTDWWDGAEWLPWSDYCAEIIGYHYLMKKDGTANERQIQSLRDSLGWNGDIGSLADTDWQDPVQLTIRREEYEGKSRFKVDYINPVDYEGFNIKKATPEEKRSIVSKYGPMFRAMGGGSTVASAPPKGKPATPPTPTRTAPSKPPTREDAPGPASAEVRAVVRTRDEAWAFVASQYKDKPQADTEEFFLKTIENVAKRLGYKDEDAMRPADWAIVAEEAAIPF